MTKRQRPQCVIAARGYETEAEIRRVQFYIHVFWIKRGVPYYRRVYEPQFLDLSPAMALEGGDDPWPRVFDITDTPR